MAINENRSKEKTKNKLLSGGLWALGGKIIGGFGVLAIVGILARLLPPPELGAYFLCLSIIFVLSSIGCFGLEQGTLRLVSEGMALRKEGNVIKIILTSFFTVLVVLITVGTTLWFWGPWLISVLFQNSLLIPEAHLMGFWVVSLGLQIFIGETFRGFHDIKFATLFTGTILGGGLSVILLLLFLVKQDISGEPLTLHSAIKFSIISNYISLLTGISILTHKLKSLKNVQKGSANISNILKVSSPLWISNISVISLAHADIWLLGSFSSGTEVAVYGAAVRIVKFVSISLIVINEVIAPIIARLNILSEKKHLEKTVRTTSGMALLAALPVFLLFLFWGKDIMSLLYGNYYKNGALVLIILTIAQLTSVATGSCGYALSMTGHGATLMKINSFTFVMAVAIAYCIGKNYAAVGIACSFAVAVILQQILTLFAAKRCCGIWTYANPRLAISKIMSLTKLIVTI